MTTFSGTRLDLRLNVWLAAIAVATFWLVPLASFLGELALVTAVPLRRPCLEASLAVVLLAFSWPETWLAFAKECSSLAERIGFALEVFGVAAERMLSTEPMAKANNNLTIFSSLQPLWPFSVDPHHPGALIQNSL